jgi:hypothetical protein
MQTEEALIFVCRQRIEAELNWGLSDRWSNRDFERLSEKIMERTQVRLSISTLKRIWGKVRYDSLPAVATLNVLAQFSGYQSWRDFAAENSKHPGVFVSAMSKNKASRKWWVEYPRMRRIAFMLLLIVIGLIVWKVMM